MTWTGGVPEGFDLKHLRGFLKMWIPTGRLGTAIDVGSHRGVWSRELASHFNEVIAVEANPETYKHLVEQTTEYPNIKRYNIALGFRDAKVGTAYHGVPSNTGACHVEGSGATLMTLLDHSAWPVDFLKLDVEGMELDVLRGGKNKIEHYRPAIMVELNGNGKRFYGSSDQAVKDWLESRGYVLILRQNKDYFYAPSETCNSLGRLKDGD